MAVNEVGPENEASDAENSEASAGFRAPRLLRFADQSIERPERFTDYYSSFAPEKMPLVVDCGSFTCKMGWASEEEPRLNYRSVVSRPRVKATGQTVTVVGEVDPAEMKGLENARSAMRSPFDSNVVSNFDQLESVLDYGFDRLGIEGGKIQHPVLLTEGPCCPLYSRTRLAELMFESYGVPSLGLGCDGVFSFNFNAAQQHFAPTGLLVSSGHTTSHVIPMYEGQPQWEGACRVPVGGGTSTEYLRNLLTVLYPQHAQMLTWERAEEMKRRSCYVAQDYKEELKAFRDYDLQEEQRLRQKPNGLSEVHHKEEGTGEDEAEGADDPPPPPPREPVLWQLPFTPPAAPAAPSEEEVARKAAAKERAGQRLRDMAAAKRAVKVSELEGQLAGLEAAKEELEMLKEAADEGEPEGESAEYAEVLANVGCASKEQLDGLIRKAKLALNKAQGISDPELEQEEADAAQAGNENKYPLLDIPDSELTEDQIKEKRRQRLLKGGEDARLRAKRKAEEERKKEQERLEEEDRKLKADPEAYLAELKESFLALRKKSLEKEQPGAGAAGGHVATLAGRGVGGGLLATASEGGATMGGGGGTKTVGVARRGERVTAAHRERMKLLTAAAFEGGKGRRRKRDEGPDDDFGARDEDWEVYKRMGTKKDGEDEEDDDEAAKKAEAHLTWITTRLKELDPEFLEKESAVPAASEVAGLPSVPSRGGLGLVPSTAVTEAHFQIRTGIERIRIPEPVFQPSMLGLFNGGIGDSMASALRRISSDAVRSAVSSSNFVFVTGGNSLYPGFLDRVATEYTMLQPLGSQIKGLRALDPLLDAWRGAQQFALSTKFSSSLFTKEEYNERGLSWFADYSVQY